MNLRVMTYNIRSGRGLNLRGGGTPRGLAKVVDVIRSFDPHIVTLQEVDVGRVRSRRMDQAGELAAALDMEMRFLSSSTTGERYGICSLTRLPIVATREIHLPLHRHDSRQRYALVTRHTWGDADLEVINTHLSTLFRERPGQVAAIAAEMAGEALLVAGDFNMTPWSPAYRMLARGLQAAGRFARTWPAPAAVFPVDHILFRGRLELVRAGAWTRGGARRASDHLPLVAEFARVATG